MSLSPRHPIHDPRNPEHELMRRKIVRKIDWRVLPSVSLLYLACFIDRSNIGNAKVAGLGKDLELTGLRFNICLAVFYITYILVEIPSNHLLRRFGPKTWLPLLVFGWGIITISAGFVPNYASLIGLRLLLGFFEGGLLPGIILHLSTLYRKDELQLRVGFFFACGTLSGAFGGLLAYAIERMDGIGGKASWSWIFVIEGLATLCVAICARFALFPSLASASFLSPAEKYFAEKRLTFDYSSWSQSERIDCEKKAVEAKPTKGSENLENSSTTELHAATSFESHEVECFERGEVFRGLIEPQAWMTGFAAMCSAVAIYSYSFFLPTLIKEMGHDRVHSQLLSAYPYIPASLLVVMVSFIADKWNVRGPLALTLIPFTVVGYVMASITESPTVRYAGVFFIAGGMFPTAPCLFTLLANNTSGMTKRATATALQIMICNGAGFLAPFLYTSEQAPRFVKGHTICLGFACLSWTLTACNVFYCWWENKARKAGARAYLVENYYIQLNENKTKAPIGDRDPAFLFTL
ncbi:hypothetical protein CROQUDRAFT_662612 [Cronartium quercuum f. sp. fusiforme G11]|uniref:Major facilitator superfamily (MFS) profile domain-containing protein n=1 Tax=Cronartium quercuum f. sp. fusiforme G11 TaxID=708437 RepID=A0A9P6T7W4_9BASI|nr:hypothetical protein CROQUDRAFT_662612 [Cronartium quercuum f. sp. fusiforme G11]